MYNDLTEYHNKLIQIRGSTADGVLPGHEKVRFYLSLKNGCEKVVLNLNNIFLFSSNCFNFVSLNFLNIHRIFYNNENKMLYNKKPKKILAYVKRWRINFLFHLLKLFSSTTHLKQIDNNIYKWLSHAYKTLDLSKLPLTTWHK